MSVEPSGPAVVAFGDDAPAPNRHTSLDRLGEQVRRLTGGRPLVPIVLVALAAIAAFLSLTSNWYTIAAVSNEEFSSMSVALRAGVNDGAALGTTYAIGLLALAMCSALALFGTPAQRHGSRLAGIVLAVGLLAVLLALRLTYEDTIRGGLLGQMTPDLDSSPGAGLIYAFLAVVLDAAALFLAPRVRAAALVEPVVAPVAADPTEAAWRRPVADETTRAVASAAPLDLTVQPARPFARPTDDERHAP